MFGHNEERELAEPTSGDVGMTTNAPPIISTGGGLSNELFRFRVVRPVQAQTPNNVLDLTGDVVTVKPPETHGAPSAGPIDPRSWDNWLAGFSTALALRSDRVTAAGAEPLMPVDWKTQAGASEWVAVRQQLVSSLVTAMQAVSGQPTSDQVEIVEGLCRLLRVQDLVSTLAQQSSQPPTEASIQTAGDIQGMVGFRPVVLPVDLFPPAVTLVRQPGWTDLYIVNDEWNRYEAGELAQVINVLPGETFEHRQRSYSKTDTETSTSTTTSTSEQDESDQTQSASLSESSSTDASLNIGASGQVQLSAQYGPAKIQTSFGAQLQSSQTTSNSHAMTTATQTVQRAVKTVSQTVIEVQSSRTVSGQVTADDHKLENTGTDVTVGLYQWLNEIHRVQLMSYPNRFVLEFEIPEPGAWLRWALENQPAPDLDSPDPGPFSLPDSALLPGQTALPLTPDQLDGDNYMWCAAHWQVAGLTPPPPQTLTMSVALSGPPDTPGANLVQVVTDTSLTVPTGYQADAWTATVAAIRDNADTSRGTAILMSVGGQAPQSTGGAPAGQQVWVINQTLSGQLGPPASEPAGGWGAISGFTDPTVNGISSGAIPISVYATSVFGFTAVVNVVCDLMTEAYLTWQDNTFDQISAGYQAMLAAYQKELDAANSQPGSAGTLAGPPELNLERAAAELRRQVIEQLIQPLRAGNFEGEDDVTTNPNSAPPNAPMAIVPESMTDADTVQFFEQAFEWENMIYICYPYYWARSSQWVADATSASADPVFDQFLNAGSARVVVPARPGFENLVAYYIQTGQIWGGSQPPAPNDPNYLSVAAEIQALEQGATDGTPYGSSWEISLPTTLLWAGTDPSTLPVNQNATIPAPTSTA
jgi:hypothetical protein